MKHRFRQRGLFRIGHAPEKDRHQQSRALIVGDLAARYAVNEERDLGARKFRAITFPANDVLRSQLDSSESKTTACTVTASPWPTASNPSPVFAFTLTQPWSTPRVAARLSRIAAM